MSSDIKNIKIEAKKRIKDEKKRKQEAKRKAVLDAKEEKLKKKSAIANAKIKASLKNSSKLDKSKTKRDKKQKKSNKETDESRELLRINDFFDMIAPSTMRFFTDYYIIGNTYRCVWAIREYPTSTTDQALLKYLGEHENVNVRIKVRMVTPLEEPKIISGAFNKNVMSTNNTDQQTVINANSNINTAVKLVEALHEEKEVLLHTAVYIELQANKMSDLQSLKTDIRIDLTRCKIKIDELYLRQREGFITIMPTGQNNFGDRFERVLPSSSVANLFPFNYSGKTDAKGLYIGKDKYGTNIIVDFNKRSDDKTNANILILGNSGQGKSYLLKLILQNFRIMGKNILGLDPESEYIDLTNNLNGTYIDLMVGDFMINVLEPKRWTSQKIIDDFIVEGEDDENDFLVPPPFKTANVLSGHISFLKDFFLAYKNFDNKLLDALEIIISKLYKNFNITDQTDFEKLAHTDYPIMSDLYDLLEEEFKNFNLAKKELYTEDMLRELCLSLNSMCRGSERIYFNGHTNVTSKTFLMFGLMGVLELDGNLKNAILFNVLSFMSNELLTRGNTTASLDEFYLFLTNRKAVEYIRNFMKRVRKRESAVIIASQNLEDFNIEGIRELTKPLFSIPTHQFLFNAGTIDKKFYLNTLQIEESEYKLISLPSRGSCLYKCGNERYHLQVHAPAYKEQMFGTAGGR